MRFYLPLEPENPDDAVWSIIRSLSDKIGEQLTTHLRAIADANPLLKGIIDRIDFNARPTVSETSTTTVSRTLSKRSVPSALDSVTLSRTSSGAVTNTASASSQKVAGKAPENSTLRERSDFDRSHHGPATRYGGL